MKGFDFLVHARKWGVKLGLETMHQLTNALGNPEKKIKFIHLAGTNGKGSTAALCAQSLQEAGYTTGLFTSPHLIFITERIQINHVPIPESTLSDLLDEIAEITRSWENSPTFFEILTACALLYFERNKVEWVVWETGMGGRLDSTNIITPEVSVITSISIDHASFLGDTLLKIADEKSGIIKSHVPVVCASQAPEILTHLQKRANELSAPWIETQSIDVTIHPSKNHRQRIEIEGIPFQLPLLGSHQIQNSLTAFAILFEVLKVPIPAIQRGFSKTVWPGRFQILRQNPPLVVDGAHNLASIQALTDTWKANFREIAPEIVFGLMEDKPYPEMIAELKSLAAQVTLVQPNNPRAIDPSLLAPLFCPLPIRIEKNLSTYWPQILKSNRPTLITGSLFLVGEALQLHQNKSPHPMTQLNELLTPSVPTTTQDL